MNSNAKYANIMCNEVPMDGIAKIQMDYNTFHVDHDSMKPEDDYQLFTKLIILDKND